MKRGAAFSLSILGGIIALLLFFQTPLMDAARSRTWDVFTRVTATVFNIQDVTPTESLQENLDRLQVENTRLKAELGDYRRLRTQLGTPPIQNLQPINAAVVSRPVDTYHSIFVISQGTRQGVSVGDAVVTQGNVLIGTVTSVQEESAEVSSLFSPTASLPAEGIHDDQEIPPSRGLIKSAFYSAIYLTTVPKDTPLVPGQTVVTTADGNKMPYGLIVGTVDEVNSQEFDAYEEARLALPYDLDSLTAVTVLAQP